MGGGLENHCVGHVYGAVGAMQPSTLYTRHTQWLSRPPPIQNHGAEKTICCNSTYNPPDDGHMYLKHVKLRIY